ncbi:MAG: transcriptional regulator [Rubrimonas sp.]
MTDTLTALLLRRSEQGAPALIWGREARPHFGAAFDRLLGAGVLVEEPPFDVWSTCDDCDCGFDWRPIQRIGARIVAACPIDAGSDTELEEDDLRSFLIDAPALVALLAGESALEGAIEEIAPKLWLLGRLDCGRAVFLALAKDAIAHPGTTLLIRAVAPGKPATLLAPAPTVAERRRFDEAGIDVVETLSALRSGPHGIDVLNPARLVPRAAGPRLIIDSRDRRVVLDGRQVALSAQSFDLLLSLAEHARSGGPAVEVRAIEERLWGAGVHRIASTVRQPIRTLRTALGETAADLIAYRRNPNGYRLMLDPQEIDIRG